jgi:hypothetical protein
MSADLQPGSRRTAHACCPSIGLDLRERQTRSGPPQMCRQGRDGPAGEWGSFHHAAVLRSPAGLELLHPRRGAPAPGPALGQLPSPAVSAATTADLGGVPVLGQHVSRFTWPRYPRPPLPAHTSAGPGRGRCLGAFAPGCTWRRSRRPPPPAQTIAGLGPGRCRVLEQHPRLFMALVSPASTARSNHCRAWAGSLSWSSTPRLVMAPVRPASTARSNHCRA